MATKIQIQASRISRIPKTPVNTYKDRLMEITASVMSKEFMYLRREVLDLSNKKLTDKTAEDLAALSIFKRYKSRWSSIAIRVNADLPKGISIPTNLFEVTLSVSQPEIWKLVKDKL